MVSIIIPAYNCEKYISKCIESVLQQEEKSFEVIVINDGSIDGTASILNYYAEKDNRVRVFHVENGGPSRARNIGLNHANGEWVLFIDADDWVDENILTKLELNDSSADIIFFGFKRLYNDVKCEICKPKGFAFSNKKNDVTKQLKNLLLSKEEFFGYTVNKVFRRTIIEQNGIRFKEGLSVREDEVFVLCYCQYINSVQTISFTPYNYRIIDTSLSHNAHVSYRNYRLLIKSEKDILMNYQDSIFKEAFLGKTYNYYLYSIIECCYGNRWECRDIISEAICFYKENKHFVNAPGWQQVLFGFPVSYIGQHLIYIVFKIRKLLKK